MKSERENKYLDRFYGSLRRAFDNEDELRAMLDKHGVAWPRCSNHIGTGWIPHVDKLICNLISMGWDKDCHQIKEKFGGLRFYVGTATEPMRDMIHDFEAMTFTMCEVCGEEGKVSNWGVSMNIKCFCPEHADVWVNLRGEE